MKDSVKVRKKRVVVDYRVYKKRGQTKIELALEMLSYARNRLGLKPEFVLFDSWYAAKKLLKRLQDYRWHFVTRLKKKSKFRWNSIKRFQKNP